jgi:hypothetical protein
MTDKIDTLKYGNLDLPVTDCKVYFTNKHLVKNMRLN